MISQENEKIVRTAIAEKIEQSESLGKLPKALRAQLTKLVFNSVTFERGHFPTNDIDGLQRVISKIKVSSTVRKQALRFARDAFKSGPEKAVDKLLNPSGPHAVPFLRSMGTLLQEGRYNGDYAVMSDTELKGYALKIACGSACLAYFSKGVPLEELQELNRLAYSMSDLVIKLKSHPLLKLLQSHAGLSASQAKKIAERTETDPDFRAALIESLQMVKS